MSSIPVSPDLDDEPVDPSRDRGFFGQPKSLANIFGVEAWERFSFYGMQGILLLYLYYSVEDGGLGIPKATAAGIVGAYGGAVYLSTILGAWVADRILGSERVLFFSAVVIMAGHIGLALIPGVAGVIVGLILVAVGSGGLKANATAVVGTLYSKADPRRDAGFSLFYLGINLGAFFGPIFTGLLQSTLGFHWGFALAAVGMAIGLTQYSFGRKNLPAIASRISNPLPASRRTLVIVVGVIGIALIVVAVLTGLITADNLALWVIGATVVATVAYFIVILSSARISATERSRVFAFIPLFVASVAFWSLYQQQFTVLTIYSDEKLNRSILGWTMPVSWVQSINPIFIIVLSGVFAALWTKLGTRAPSTPVKFALGTMIMGLGVLAVPPLRRRRREQHAAAVDRADPVRLHRRRAAALAGRAVGDDEARPGGASTPRWSRCSSSPSPSEPPSPVSSQRSTPLTSSPTSASSAPSPSCSASPCSSGPSPCSGSWQGSADRMGAPPPTCSGGRAPEKRTTTVTRLDVRRPGAAERSRSHPPRPSTGCRRPARSAGSPSMTAASRGRPSLMKATAAPCTSSASACGGFGPASGSIAVPSRQSKKNGTSRQCSAKPKCPDGQEKR